jgi:hypothetical protein
MNQENATLLHNYVKNKSKKRYGVSKEQPQGSGPGGASRMSYKTGKKLANLAKDPLTTAAELDTLRQGYDDISLTRSIRDMKDVAKIYNDATTTIKKATSKGKKFRDL